MTAPPTVTGAVSDGTAIARLSAVDLLAAYAAGTLSPVEVTDVLLERCAAVQELLNPFALLMPESARRRARASEARWRAGRPEGPLDGVPVTLKENIATVGVPLLSGTAAGEGAAQTANGPAAQAVIDAGAVVLGKTVMPDYGMLSSGVSSLYGITRSPWNREWTVGGSSGGAGAAAAALCGPLHVGSDIGGSVRLPATWLGLLGLKPTFGRVPVDPPYMGRCIGPLTRSTEDAALLMTALVRADDRDHTALPREDLPWRDLDRDVTGIRVAVHTDAGAGLPTDPEVAAAVDAAAEVFAAGGAVVERIDPFLTRELLAGLDLFLRVRSWLDYQALPQHRRAKVLPYIAEWVHGGADVPGSRVLAAYQDVQRLRQVTVAATRRYDLALSPVAPVAAFPATWPGPANDPAQALEHIGYTAPYNFSEQPAASVNCGFTTDGRPLGLQVAGRRFDDLGVLRAMHWYEQARPAGAVPHWPDVLAP